MPMPAHRPMSGSSGSGARGPPRRVRARSCFFVASSLASVPLAKASKVAVVSLLSVVVVADTPGLRGLVWGVVELCWDAGRRGPAWLRRRGVGRARHRGGMTGSRLGVELLCDREAGPRGPGLD